MAEEVKRVDRRVAKTRRAIRNAFVRLLTEKEMDKITIKELAELADVDRKTVYNYYEGVYDILDELENELVARFERVVESLDYNVGNPLKVFEALTNMLSSDLELYGRLMQVGVQTRLIEKIGNYLREKVRGAIAKKGGVFSEKTELAVEYVTSGMFSAYRYWFHSDRKQSLEEFSREVGKLVLSGIATFLNE